MSEGAHVSAPANQWTQISVTATAPAGTGFVLPVVYGLSLEQDEVFYTDDWQLEQPTDGGSASFAFSSSEPGSTFECRLDGPGAATGSFADCTPSPKAYTGLAAGAYTFSVRATDAAANTDQTPASSAFTVAGGDTQAPETTIDSGPGANLQPNPSFEPGVAGYRNDAGTVAQSSAQAHSGTSSAEVTRTQAGSGYSDLYDNDSSRWPAVTAGQKYTFTAWVRPTATRDFFIALLWRDGAKGHVDVSEGAHVSAPANQWTQISVTATAPAGTGFVLPVVYGLSLDQDEVFYTDDWQLEQPADGGSASFAFSSSEPGSTFECRLDGPGAATGSFADCTPSPKAYTGLAAGAYTFSVRATDAAANTDQTPASSAFTVAGGDTQAPETTIDSGPGANLQPNPSFEPGVAGYRNDAGTVAQSSAQAHSGTSSAEVTRTQAGSGYADLYDNDSSRWPAVTAGQKYTFTAWVRPTATRDFFIALLWRDGAKAHVDVSEGAHVSAPANQWTQISVTATAPAGTGFVLPVVYGLSLDQDEVFYTDDWQLEQPTDGGSASFAFSSSEPGSTFECRLDGPGAATGSFADCTPSPKAYTGLAAGAYTFSVRATDAAANTDQTPASSAFTVAGGDTQAPETTIDSGPGANLQPNPSFEPGVAGYRNDAGTVAQSSAQAHSGTSSAEVTRTQAGSGYADLYDNDSSRWPAVTAGQKYTFTAWVRPTATRDFFIALLWRDGAKGHVDVSEGAQVSAPANQWTQISVTATAPAGTGFVLPVVYGLSLDQDEVFYTDDWQLEQPTDGGSASFAFSSSEPGSTFECRLDGPGAATGSFADCTPSPKAYTGLAAGAYTFSVRATDAAANTDQTPASSAFTVTLPASFTDTTFSDFSAGTPGADTYVSETDNGEVTLKPTEGSEFSGSSLPAGWQSCPWSAPDPENCTPGTGATVSGGSLHADGAYARTTATYGSGRSLEFRATFNQQNNQHVGFGVDLNNSPNWAIFSVKFDGTFNARTNNGGAATDTPLPSSLIGAPHLYRIEWDATQVRYYVDGDRLRSRPTPRRTTQMRPLVTDLTAGGPELTVDWLRMSPYPGTGTFDSRVFDAGAGQTADWGALAWNSATPAGTGTTTSVRTGNTPTPDGSWSAFTPIASSGGDIPGNSRYVQYRAQLTSGDPAQTPTLSEVSIGYVANPDVTAPTITGRSPSPDATDVPRDTNVQVQFSEPMEQSTINSSSVHLQKQGSGTDVPANVSYAGTTATLDPDADLDPSAIYTVTVDGSVNDQGGNALGSPDGWSFTTAALSFNFTDTTASDFGAGTPGADTYVSETANGEVILKPTEGQEFSAGSLPDRVGELHLAGRSSPDLQPWRIHGLGRQPARRRWHSRHRRELRLRPRAGVRRNLRRRRLPARGLRGGRQHVGELGDVQHRQHEHPDPGSHQPRRRRTAHDTIPASRRHAAPLPDRVGRDAGPLLRGRQSDSGRDPQHRRLRRHPDAPDRQRLQLRRPRPLGRLAPDEPVRGLRRPSIRASSTLVPARASTGARSPGTRRRRRGPGSRSAFAPATRRTRTTQAGAPSPR